MIGIIGGIGPEAGNFLHSLILKNTKANSDQEHFGLILYSANNIPDRSNFLENKSNINPAYEISLIIKKLIKLGVDVVVIACNQVYAPEIFNVVLRRFSDSNVIIINVINEVFKSIGKDISKIGILSRTGLYNSRMFEKDDKAKKYKFVYLNNEQQNTLDKIIGDKNIGIKGGFHLKSNNPKQVVKQSIKILKEKGAEVIVLACTELALVVDKETMESFNIIDTNEILARAAIEFKDKTRLKI